LFKFAACSPPAKTIPTKETQMQETPFRLEPFRDDEIKAAIDELFSFPGFVEGMKLFLPEPLLQHIMQAKNEVNTAADFQAKIVAPFLKVIEKSSIAALSASGFEHLDPNQRYLFISNHRDIVLDSAFLNIVLFENGFETSQIAIGDNLMMHRISELLFRINKSFVVKRTGTPRELYGYSMQLSNYIHDLINSKSASVWIAQREGRAKDGNDRTQAGLLTMLGLSGKKDLKQHFQSLNIVPVAISYEYDPCGMLKTQEYLDKLADSEFKKSFQQDVQYMLLGIKGQKGRVHFHFGEVLTDALEALGEEGNSKKQVDMLAEMIDQSIHQHYELRPINYIAHDLLTGMTEYSAHYTPEQLEWHLNFFEDQIKMLKNDVEGAGRKYLLEMYANPLINANSYA
jgi:glycerol-3-phosphate O-acyltransferase